LAEYFGCAPSQINYVLATRFTIDDGYVIESRRGGGGYIRIVRVIQSGSKFRYLIGERIGETIGEVEAGKLIGQLEAENLITSCEADIMRSAISSQALSVPIPDSMKDALRARVLKAMLTSIARKNREGQASAKKAPCIPSQNGVS
ncbi:MAG: CtsR family transcriptional regulator, partial [Clostridia bacterium]|nr:CtsR family transcriptional regulator [Clostridia bacterium]